MAKFKDILSNTTGNLKILPILHSCDGYGFRDILQSKTLKTSICDVFGQEFLYAYYGIPSYRKKLDEATNNLAFFPVCFILDYSKLPNIHKIHPFDTGAFIKIPEIKKDHFYPKMDIKDFELNSDIIEASKVVEKFYSTNYNYLRNQPTAVKNNFQSSELEAQSYISLISDTSNSRYDNRASTIELIFDKEINLTKESLVQVILPSDMLDEYKNILFSDFDIQNPIGYYSLKSNPQENFGAIYNEFMKYVIQNKLS